MASGLDLETAAAEARLSFEALLAASLTPVQINDWQAAKNEIQRAQEAPTQVTRHALRKPRRPNWYRGPTTSDTNWPPLKAYLLGRRGWVDEAVASLDGSSTEIVSLLEDPSQALFKGRGMVVGYVQSGKTASMLAVTAKAVDAGYRFVIVLAGLTNSLRRQTQGRFETDLRARNPLGWHMHTSYEDGGDFRTPPNLWFSVMDPVQAAIVKKNVTPLRRLIRTIEKTPPALRARMPVLILDDECDQASVNASGSQFDMSAINGAIRRLLALLPRAQYIGYTATPFANVLINAEKPDGALDDLYPEDFIVALPRPQGYSGIDTIFGDQPADANDESASEVGQDMLREVPEADVACVRPPSAAMRASFSPGIPKSLSDALSYFVLASAERRRRGQAGQHSSMLVHTTVYTLSHERLASEIRDWLPSFREDLQSAEGSAKLTALWADEQARVPPEKWGRLRTSLEDLRPHITDVLDAVAVVVENSSSQTRLDFDTAARTFIIVGGSVLARGLTIEGLSVSYFVRSSSQYDTLLQMGRWFGFRSGYEDLPRIWMTAELSTAFRDLGLVEAELRSDIAQYIIQDLTPVDFAVRIRQLPGMTITAASKMVAAEACDVSFSGEHLQTIRLPYQDEARLVQNWRAGARLVETAGHFGEVEARAQGRLIRNVPIAAVLTFLKEYVASSKDRFSPDLIDYLVTESSGDEQAFQTWNIGVVEPLASKGASAQPLGPFGAVRLVNRSRLNIPRSDALADIKALMSRRDILMDVDLTARSEDWEQLKRERQALIGDATPLLLLYAIDPQSSAPVDSSYRANLGAVGDVLGLGLVLPDRGTRRQYVRVRLPREDAGEDLLAELGETN